MRAAFVLFLAVVALAFLAPLVTAQPPPRNGSHIAFYNDSDCTHHIHSMEVRLPSSSKCVAEHYRHHNESAVFQCVTSNNQTDLTFDFYNGTAICDNTALISYSSSAPAHTCAPITLTYDGHTATVYGHIRCEDDRVSTLDAAVSVARQLISAKKQTAPTNIAELIKSKRFHTSKMFV